MNFIIMLLLIGLGVFCALVLFAYLNDKMRVKNNSIETGQANNNANIYQIDLESNRGQQQGSQTNRQQNVSQTDLPPPPYQP
jgi:hypothetical protein